MSRGIGGDANRRLVCHAGGGAWRHPAITALNPAGLADTAGALITDPSQKIILCNGPRGRGLGPVTATAAGSFPPGAFPRHPFD